MCSKDLAIFNTEPKLRNISKQHSNGGYELLFYKIGVVLGAYTHDHQLQTTVDKRFLPSLLLFIVDT